MKAIEISLRNALDAMAIFEDGNWAKHGIIQSGSTIYSMDESFYNEEEAVQNFEDFVGILKKHAFEIQSLEIEEI